MRGLHPTCSSKNAANITRTICGSSSPRCASVNGATLWTMGVAARKMRPLHLRRVHRAGLRLEPGSLQQLAHAGGDDAVKLAGVGGHGTQRGRERATVAVAIDSRLAG
jgi:hypothetical protein